MKLRFLKSLFSAGLIFASGVPAVLAPSAANAAEYHHRYRAQRNYVRHRRHIKTAKRVGIGAAGGAVAGALIVGPLSTK